LLVGVQCCSYEQPEWHSPWHRISAAPFVMLLYLGAATTSYLIVETATRL